MKIPTMTVLDATKGKNEPLFLAIPLKYSFLQPTSLRTALRTRKSFSADTLRQAHRLLGYLPSLPPLRIATVLMSSSTLTQTDLLRRLVHFTPPLPHVLQPFRNQGPTRTSTPLSRIGPLTMLRPPVTSLMVQTPWRILPFTS